MTTAMKECGENGNRPIVRDVAPMAPEIMRVEVSRTPAEEAADYWRFMGYSARILTRKLRAGGATMMLFVVVVSRKAAT
jgi:hypothetical protein